MEERFDIHSAVLGRLIPSQYIRRNTSMSIKIAADITNLLPK
jgi:hypothetical protein